MSNGAGIRAVAARVLSGLLSGQGSLTSQLDRHAGQLDEPLIRELCFGVCRHYFVLRKALDRLVEKPLRNKDRDIDCLLLTGLYQLHFMRIPDHAAVNETVSATGILKKPWARGLVNGVLRRAIAGRAEWTSLLESDDPEIRHLHAGWLVDTIRRDWPDRWLSILDNNNLRAPMTLRVNLARHSRDDYLRRLREADIQARSGKLADSAVYLEQPRPVAELPGFDSGDVSVQDEASQLVPSLLDARPGHRVLDACAAPGGKAAHLLESEPSLTTLLALDNNPARLRQIESTLTRLGLRAQVLLADAGNSAEWWDGMPFDRILLDAPCSATGVIRRHPDIKVLRRPEDIDALAVRQLALLEKLWDCLAPGGRLLYTTCSVLRQENDDTLATFVSRCPDAKFQAIAADWGVKCRYGRQLLPDSTASDGFYFALLEKGSQLSG